MANPNTHPGVSKEQAKVLVQYTAPELEGTLDRACPVFGCQFISTDKDTFETHLHKIHPNRTAAEILKKADPFREIKETYTKKATITEPDFRPAVPLPPPADPSRSERVCCTQCKQYYTSQALLDAHKCPIKPLPSNAEEDDGAVEDEVMVLPKDENGRFIVQPVPGDRTRLQCPRCDAKIYYNLMQTHLTKIHPDVQDKFFVPPLPSEQAFITIAITPGQKRGKCPICEKEFTARGMNHHIVVMHKRTDFRLPPEFTSGRKRKRQRSAVDENGVCDPDSIPCPTCGLRVQRCIHGTTHSEEAPRRQLAATRSQPRPAHIRAPPHPHETTPLCLRVWRRLLDQGCL